jgi:hypothetical protein
MHGNDLNVNSMWTNFFVRHLHQEQGYEQVLLQS